MKTTRSIGMLLLAIYLIVIGLTAILGLNLGQLAVVVPGLAVAAGVLLLLGK
jgi:hypothetical protein